METRRVSGHVPVMVETALHLLACRAGGVYVDGTMGGGGYAAAILREIGPKGILVGLDWDDEAITRARERFPGDGNKLLLKKASFADLPEILAELGLGPVDGVVIDLGVSTYQLEDASRGFSFLQDGPLDMRMDRERSSMAADLVNRLPEKELAQMIFSLGEERWAKRIARVIVSRRKLRPFSRTGELAELIAGVVPKTKDTRRIHPATRTFQALRIAVNQELEALQQFLSTVLDVLRPGGRLCVVSFHSLEDRMVKNHFREWARPCRCPVEAAICRCERKPLVRHLTRKALRPTQEEIGANPRARSARLRAVEKYGEAEEER